MKAGYVTIIGLPNVGKSTFMNRILGQKLSIVSKKPQTTRHRIIGILTEGETQVVFTDTPGVIRPKYSLQEMMVQSINRALSGADIVLLMVAATKDPDEEDIQLIEKLKGLPTIVAINKIDLIKKERLLPIIDFYRRNRIDEVFPISALYGDGVDELKRKILDSLPEGDFYYPEDLLTEHPERFFVCEIIREKIFERYQEEIPYATTVEIDEFTERSEGKYYIRAVVYVERKSQKGIIIGKKGRMLKEVGTEARQAIEEFLNHPVYLDLWVKVKEGWRRKSDKVKELGYRP
ncbi:MAG TPA: GTPase Era [bacterium (Candidatus Stahlbacteria)]|nr:GTPase Era [Candidatus Stahlbacteria bacterium]